MAGESLVLKRAPLQQRRASQLCSFGWASDLDATLRRSHDDSDASKILDSHNRGETTVAEGEPFVSRFCVASFFALRIEFLSEGVSAREHSGSHTAGLPNARRDARVCP